MTVPEGRLFLLGDERQGSLDSTAPPHRRGAGHRLPHGRVRPRGCRRLALERARWSAPTGFETLRRPLPAGSAAHDRAAGRGRRGPGPGRRRVRPDRGPPAPLPHPHRPPGGGRCPLNRAAGGGVVRGEAPDDGEKPCAAEAPDDGEKPCAAEAPYDGEKPCAAEAPCDGEEEPHPAEGDGGCGRWPGWCCSTPRTASCSCTATSRATRPTTGGSRPAAVWRAPRRARRPHCGNSRRRPASPTSNSAPCCGGGGARSHSRAAAGTRTSGTTWPVRPRRPPRRRGRRSWSGAASPGALVDVSGDGPGT